MAIERLQPDLNPNDGRLDELRQLFPEIFADGKIDLEILHTVLEGSVWDEEELDTENFGLSWPGKRKAYARASAATKNALVPQPGQGLNENTTRNVFIEGENLEVLKLLKHAYKGRVKMIYIDPPYNTGNDFIYNDDFAENKEEYLRRTGQVDEEGRKLTTNTKADGRFHSNWLSMMYPRLRLARQLLRDDGVIFVSIDDNEVHHLRAIMSEVFGDECFQGNMVWQHSIQPKGYTGKMSVHHNHIIVFSKSADYELGSLERTDAHNKNYSNRDNDPNGKWRPGDVRNALYRRNLIYDLKTPSGRTIKPPKNGWRWQKSTMDEKIASGEIVYSDDETRIIRKIYLSTLEGRTPETMLFGKEVGTTRSASKELKELYGDQVPFDTPKPVSLIQKLLQIGTRSNEEDIVLDFYAGSGTTGQATLAQNESDKGDRRFLLVQFPEEVDGSKPAGRNAIELGLKCVSDITMDRIKRYLKKENDKSGITALTMSRSHFRAWHDVESSDLTALERAFAEAESPLIQGWTPEDLRTEVMLLEGFPLDSRVEKVKALKKNEVHQVSHEWHAHRLLVCLDKSVAPETIKDLQLAEGDIFICLDTAIDDKNKVRLSDKGLIKTI